MALVEHLRELPNRLGISLLALAVCVIIALVFREHVFDLLKGRTIARPLPAGQRGQPGAPLERAGSRRTDRPVPADGLGAGSGNPSRTRCGGWCGWTAGVVGVVYGR
jgi:hypothetical protein